MDIVLIFSFYCTMLDLCSKIVYPIRVKLLLYAILILLLYVVSIALLLTHCFKNFCAILGSIKNYRHIGICNPDIIRSR